MGASSSIDFLQQLREIPPVSQGADRRNTAALRQLHVHTGIQIPLDTAHTLAGHSRIVEHHNAQIQSRTNLVLIGADSSSTWL